MRRFLAGAVCALSLSLLSGCGADSVNKTISEAPELKPVTALTRQQATEATDVVAKALAAADAKKDPKLLTPLVADTALKMRSMQYKLASSSPVPKLSFESDSYTPTTAVTWPRPLVVVSQAGKGTVPAVLLLEQKSARQPYQLTSWGRIFPGERIETMRTELGAAPVAADAKGYLATPEQAVKDYAEVVGDNQKSADKRVRTDTLMKTVNAETAALSEAIDDNGTITWQATPGKIIAASLTPDGSALVFGTITMTTTIEKTKDLATIELKGPMATLLGDDAKVEKKVELTKLASVVLLVPPEKSKQPIRAIAAEYVPLAAKAIKE